MESSTYPMRVSDRMSVETTMRAIDPRADKDAVLLIVGRALDNCDPGELPAVQVTRWPNVTDGRTHA